MDNIVSIDDKEEVVFADEDEAEPTDLVDAF